MASITDRAGFCYGMTSSDGVVVAGEWEQKGDWTGPGAARHVLRHQAVDYAILETARGGLMRRGLVVSDADCAAVTNVSADHLGYWGLYSIEEMAKAKLTVALGVKQGGAIVLNADNAALVKAWGSWKYRRPDLRVLWFSTQKKKNMNSWLQNGTIFRNYNGESRPILKASDIPLSIGGAAIHNLENAMVAMLLATETGVDDQSIVDGLCSLQPNPLESKGRSNLFHYKGATVFIDFAHNEDGMRRIVQMASRIPSTRCLLVLGQAGDRGPELLAGLAAAASDLNADTYYIKELPGHSYGVQASEVADKLIEGLVDNGISISNIRRFENELDAARNALEDLRKGDLLLLLTHEEYSNVVSMLSDS